MFTVPMEKITDNTEFDFYTSEKAIAEGRGKNKVNGMIYVERIRAGRTPLLSSRYDDLTKVLRAKQEEYIITKTK